VTVRDVDGVTHHVEVQGTTLFEAAAAALGAFREQGWSADALTPNAVLRVEVQAPAIAHDVPVKAIDRWLQSPAASPRDRLSKWRFGGRG
jgi:hypothetical protein